MAACGVATTLRSQGRRRIPLRGSDGCREAASIATFASRRVCRICPAAVAWRTCRDDLRALASQQGFAGELTGADSVAHWERRYDYQPSSGFADRATLARTGDVLLETGAEQPYTEQWTRAKGRGTDRFGALLSEAGTGSRGVIVRVGAWLMYLRARSRPLPHGASLRAIIDAQSALHDARALLDFEISFGTLEDDGTWHILRSTLPYKAGRRWHVELPGPTRASVTISDVATDGEPVRRVWDVTDAD